MVWIQLTQRVVQRHTLLEYYFITRFYGVFKLWRCEHSCKDTHNDAPQSVGLLSTSDQLVAETST